jgi:DNA-binding YbaB/EbfC family protein
MTKGKGQKGSVGGMMAQARRMQEQIQRTQQMLAEEMVEASAGGGAVRIVMSGTQECKSVIIDPGLATAGDSEMLQDLVLLAINQAIQESRALAARHLGSIAGNGLGALGFGS